MRKWILLLAVLVLSGCQAQAYEFLEVELTASSTELRVNEPFKLFVNVAYGEENIDDETIVEMEFIENYISTASVNPDALGDGEYELELQLMSPGEHIIIAHVSYEDYYEMRQVLVDVKE